jgi:CRISPR-associated endonuclease Csn1
VTTPTFLWGVSLDPSPLSPSRASMEIPGERRLAKAHPLFQRRRLLEELNALMLVRAGEKAQRLTHEQRDLLLLKLKDKAKVSFESLRKTLKLDPDARFNKENENRTDLKGDEVAALMGGKARFGNRWVHLSPDEQWAIIERLEAVESEAEDADFRAWVGATYDLTPEQAKAVANAHPPAGYGRFGDTATRRLIDALRDGEKDGRVIVYSEAVELAGLGHHSDFRTGELFPWDEDRPPKAWEYPLPYYGRALDRHIMPGTGEPTVPKEMRIGRLTNPTVHIGLNQLRRITNILIRRFGLPPTEIAIELARDLKQTDDDKKEENRKNNLNRLAAQKRSEKLLAIGQPDTGANRALLKLWEELNPSNCLDRRCVYTGQQISVEMLFSPNGIVQVDHILPYAVTLDDSNGNKILCMREANQIKRRRSPYAARLDFESRFGSFASWDEISRRAAQLSKGKARRFEPDAMDRFAENGDFLARHLKDTQYLSRLSREYLSALYPERGEDSSHIWVSPGRLTAMVRRKLGLERGMLPNDNLVSSDVGKMKNRLDHRHHAIDAAVVAVIDRSFLQKAQYISGRFGDEEREKIEFPDPWPTFREDLRAAVNAIIVSHRTDHGTASKAGLPKGKDATAGRLHNDTAYGLTGETDAKGNSIVVRRVPITNIKKLADIDKVRDPDLKAALYRATEGLDGKEFEKAILDLRRLGPLQFRNINRVRMVEPLTVIPIRDKEGRIYKGYKGDSNYRYDVWEMKDGAWQAEVVSTFDAHQPGWASAIRAANPTARKVLSLHQNDLLAIEREGEARKLMRVVKFGQNGQITLVEPQESGDLKKRDAAPKDEDPFKYFAPTCGGLKKAKARQVRIDEIGRVLDPGFPARTARRPTRKQP